MGCPENDLAPPGGGSGVFPEPGAQPTTLDALALQQAVRVVSLSAPHGAPEWPARLEEIGFLPGERVCVLARGLPGQDPLVVRVGDSTFALRRAEAACVTVEKLDEKPGDGAHGGDRHA